MHLNERIRKYAYTIVPCIHGARLSESAAQLGKRMDELIDFSVNVNPLPFPGIQSIVRAGYRNLHYYPDNGYAGFRKAAAGCLKVSPDNIVPGNGSSELIRLFAETVIEPGDKVLIPFPTFGEYEVQCRLFGAEINHVDYGKLGTICPDNYKALFLCNPNNPTGELLCKNDVLKLVENCISTGIFIFVDEAFIELANPGDSIVDAAVCNDFIVVLRSLTKTYAIPGLRAGLAVASSNFAEILNNVRLHWNMNSIAAAAGERILGNNQDYIIRSLALIKKERDWLTSKLGGIRGFKPYPSSANFILVDVSGFGLSSIELTERMLRKGIIIRECSSFNLENHIRVAVRARAENRKLIAAFSTVITEWGKELADKEIGNALTRGAAVRSRIDCEYYPCHFSGQDCTFCFCPFYPCGNTKTGGELIRRSTGGTVWSCAGCNFIHRGEIADSVLKGLMNGKKVKDIWISVMEPLL